MDAKRVQVESTAPLRRRGRGGYGKEKNGVVCMYWLQGRCNRNPCRFVHGAGEVNIIPKPTIGNNYTYHRKNPTDSDSNSNSKKRQRQLQQQSLTKSGSSGDGTQANHTSHQDDSHPESHKESYFPTSGSSGDGTQANHTPHQDDSHPESHKESYFPTSGSSGDGTQANHTPHQDDSHPESHKESYFPTSGSSGDGTQANHTPHQDDSHPESHKESYFPTSGSSGDGTQANHTPHQDDSHPECYKESYFPTSGSSGDGTQANHTSQQDSHPQSHKESYFSTSGSSGDGTHANHTAHQDDSHPESHEESSFSTSGTSGDGTQANHICQQDSHPASPEKSLSSSKSTRSLGDGILNSCFFMRLAQLDGHNKTVTGIALPSGSNKLYTASGDGDVRVWDCHTGQCVDQGNLGAQIGCLISQGPWLFAGSRNLVKAWNLKIRRQYSLDEPVGQVYALEATTEDVLFAGTEDGSIFIWKYNPENDSFALITILKGHTASVLSLQVGWKSLYSGSMDNTIRRWDLNTLTCSQTLFGHNAAVTSLVLCQEGCLLSCSLDQTIKIWACTEDGSMEVIHTRNEDHAILALFGMSDANDKSILCCSCNDNSVKLYELPSFTERGRIFGKQQVGRIQSGPGGLFFTGDGTGQVAVWKWLTPHTP